MEIIDRAIVDKMGVEGQAMKRFAMGLMIALMSASTGYTNAADPQGALLLTGAKVLDPSGERWLEGMQVLVVDRRIETIAPAGGIKAPGGAVRLDLTGLYLLPGLLDLHSHLLLHPYDEPAS